MNILFTIHHRLDADSGAAGTTMQIAASCRDLGHTTEILSHDSLPRRLPESLAGLVFPFVVLARVLRAWTSRGRAPDVIDASTGDAALVALIPRRMRRSTIVTRSHGSEHVNHHVNVRAARAGQLGLSWKYPLYNGGLLLHIVAMSQRRSDAATFLNDLDRRYATRHLGVANPRTHRLDNGLPSYLVGLEVAFGPPPTADRTIAIVGSHLHRKGTAHAAPALAALLRKRPAARLLFLGTKCPPETVLRDYPVDVHTRIRVVPSYARSELPDLLTGAHICLAPSLAEGWGKGLTEAMASGLAPVATATGGTRAIVAHGESGLIVGLRDRTGLEREMLRLVDDPDLLDRLRRGAYRRAQELTWHSVALARTALYQAVIDRPAAR